MPTDTTITLAIACDNPACPGNDLDPTKRDGWLFVTTEVYGEATSSHVVCSYACLAGASTSVARGELAWPEPPPQQIGDAAP